LQEGSWVASLSLLGAIFGCLVGGMMLQLGRKMSLLLVALPFSASWLLTVFAQRVEMMYSTSFIGGFCSAVTLLATQVILNLPFVSILIRLSVVHKLRVVVLCSGVRE